MSSIVNFSSMCSSISSLISELKDLNESLLIPIAPIVINEAGAIKDL